MAEREGTGRQGQGGRQQSQQGGASRQQGGQGGGARQQQQQQQDLKAREYRGEDGQIHHHTRTYMQQHGKDGSGGGKDR